MSMQLGRNDPCRCGSGKKYKKCCEGKTAFPSPQQIELKELVSLFQVGRFVEVENGVRGLLGRYPDAGVGWKLLGAVLGVQGKNALQVLQQAAQLLPTDPEVHCNLGTAWKAHGLYQEAIASYRRSIDICPTDASAHLYLADSLLKTGQLESALLSCRQCLKLNAQDPEAHYVLGNILYENKSFDLAANAYRQAVQFAPRFADARNKLGNALYELKQREAAVVAYRQALEIDPNFAEAYSNLGNVLNDFKQHKVAQEACLRALTLAPNFAQAHLNLGNALQALQQFDQAVASFRRALAINPHYVDAYFNLGNLFRETGQIEDAQINYQQALALNPSYCDVQSGLLFTLSYSNAGATPYSLELAQAYGRTIAQQVNKRFTAWLCEIKPKRLRVGIVSGDLHAHPVGFFLESVLRAIDPAQVELIAYPAVQKTDELTERIRPLFSAWKPIHEQNDADAASLIHADKLHILLDLSGHTSHNRLPVFAYKPAPVQATWLGYFATTGVAEMDYLLADVVGVPQQQHEQFTEQVWYLPNTRLCFTPPAEIAEVGPLPALDKGYLTFGCFQRIAKISNEVLRVWSRILTDKPNARLRMACAQLSDAVLAAHFAQRIEAQGIDLKRVDLHGAISRAEYLAAHADVDMILDTFPYPGGTTTCEALWMGVPTLTLMGDTLLARQGASLLTAAGLSDWIASSETDYVKKAVKFASDLPTLATLRAGLRQQALASPLFDAPRFARNFEAALWGMWRERGLEIDINEPM